MNEYEILLMLDPELAEERQTEIVSRTHELVDKGDGTWLSHDVWGRRRLAYEIDHKADGTYHLLQFDAEPATLDEITRVLKITDGVMRHMATRRVKGGGRAAPPPLPPVEERPRQHDREERRPAPAFDAEPAGQSRPPRTRPSPPSRIPPSRSRRSRSTLNRPSRSSRRRPRRRRRRRPSMANINRVVLVGNLTKDPELRQTGGGTSVCKLRLAVNTRRKDETGQWVDKPNYFDVSVFGNQAESCSQYLSKGRPVGVDGRLEWREWEATDGSGKRQAVEVVAESVQFLGSRGESGGDAPQFVPAGAAGESADFPSSATDDDIPF